MPDFQLSTPNSQITNKYPRFSIVLPLRVSRSLPLLANKQTSPIFNCVTRPVSVSLTSLARLLRV